MRLPSMILDANTRRWIYGITTASLVVLGVYGIVDGQQIAAWTGLAAAITGLAMANTRDEGAKPRRAIDEDAAA